MASSFLKKLKKQKMAVGIVGQKIVFYGDNGTGKTTVAIELGNKICKMVSKNPEAAPMVISLENGTNAVDNFYPVDGTDYDNVRKCLAEITNSKNLNDLLDISPVIIVDGAEKIPTIAKDYVTEKKDIETLGDLSFGKGYDIFRSYTDAAFIKFMALKGVTIIFIYHAEIDADTKYAIPSGSSKENGVCKYIRDNSDFAFYLDKPIDDKGKKLFSRAHCDDTKTHFGRNRYGEGAETFDIDFNADSIINYIEDCGKNLAKKKGVDFTTIVEKQEELSHKMTHDELIVEVSRIGKILFETSAKDRANEIIKGYTENTNNGKISEIDDDNQLEYLISDLTELASDKDIEI